MTAPSDLRPSDDESLALLEEVRDYLLRLPVVPMTRDLARRVDQHVSRQRSVLVAPGAKDSLPLVGHVESRKGVPILLATLHGRKLRLHAAPMASMDDEQQLLSALSDGITIALNPAPR